MQRLSRWNVGSSITASSHGRMSPSPNKSNQSRTELLVTIRSEKMMGDFPRGRKVTQCDVM
jgi:hypothetical protein